MDVTKSQITGHSTVCLTAYNDPRQTKKLRVIDRCDGISPVTGEFPARRVSNADKAST